MASVEVLGVPREELAHYRRDSLLAAFEQYVDVVVHESPSIDGALPVSNVFSQSFQKQGPVLVVFKYVCFIYSPHHDVMQSAGDI